MDIPVVRKLTLVEYRSVIKLDIFSSTELFKNLLINTIWFRLIESPLRF